MRVAEGSLAADGCSLVGSGKDVEERLKRLAITDGEEEDGGVDGLIRDSLKEEWS